MRREARTVMMKQRQTVIRKIAEAILAVPTDFITRVGIDGFDGAGKTWFADELGKALEAAGASVIRASVDGFHNPTAVRYRRGRLSPEGFYQDSYDYATLKRVLLDPLNPGGSGRYISAVFDHTTNSPVTRWEKRATAGDVLIFDGIFLHRPELRSYWDLSIFLDVSVENSIARLGERDGGSTDPGDPRNRRYIEGQKLYVRECLPAEAATIAVDNNELSLPKIVRGEASTTYKLEK